MKWTAEQRKALRESIAHWERMREYRKPLPKKYEAPNAKHCACCQLADRQYVSGRSLCIGCPIYEYKGVSQCYSTPYEEAAEKFWDWVDGTRSRRTWVRAATKEIDFLKKVLEAGK